MDANVPTSFDVQEETRNDSCSKKIQSRSQAWILGVYTTSYLQNEDRINFLNEIGFVWSAKGSNHHNTRSR
jgi:hypothetical protein